MTPRFLFAAFAAVLACLPACATAQRTRCVTTRTQCQAGGDQPAGTLCHCQQNPGVWGTVVTGSSEDAAYPEIRRQRSERPELRNDDLDDGDDVLAGPRHHRQREREDEVQGP